MAGPALTWASLPLKARGHGGGASSLILALPGEESASILALWGCYRGF